MSGDWSHDDAQCESVRGSYYSWEERTKNMSTEMLIDTKMYNDLVADRKRLIGVLQLAVKYLDHPDVQAIPFALPAKVVAERAHDALLYAEEL